MQGNTSNAKGRPHLAAMAGVLMLAGGFLATPADATLRRVPVMYPTIQAAIYAAIEGDTILISPGVYRGEGNRNIELDGKDLVVTSVAGPDQTIIDAENAWRGFRAHQWETPAARIENLTIINGNAFAGDGGGIVCDIASPTISNCRIFSCRARYGGGIALLIFGGTVEGCVIAGNQSEDGGGGLATRFAGGITITDCVITGNWTEHGGGGVAFNDGMGGNIMRGCTVSANSAAQGGGGVGTGEAALLDRCILWGNCAPLGADLYDLFESTSFQCCDVDSSGVDHGVYAEIYYDANCIFTDPGFCGPVPCRQTTAGDWTLQDSSPCAPSNSPCGQLIGALGVGCASLPSGACCLAGGACVVIMEAVCATQQGTYQGDGVPCLPDPCGPTAVERTSWGRIKAAYR